MKAIVYQGSHLVVVVAALVFLVGSAPGAPASAASKSFLTLQFGRTQLALAGPGCSASPGAVPLGSVVRQMWRLGYAGTGAVALDITGQGWSSCRGRIRYAGWRTLQRWHHRYRFHLISAGRHYTDVRRLRPSEQRADICGSLAAFRRHGFRAAWGMFAYPDDHSDSRVQQHVTAGCFAFGRTYSHDVNTRPSLRSPWFQRTYSIDGGACNLTGLDCYRIVTPVWPAHYTSPRLLASLMRPSVGQWRVVQMYRFVRGRRLSGAIRWNCRGPNWRGHWTTRIELYCAKDYLSAVRSIPSTVRVVSPTAVARAWGRAPVLP
jgi:hypothetical protein